MPLIIWEVDRIAATDFPEDKAVRVLYPDADYDFGGRIIVCYRFKSVGRLLPVFASGQKLASLPTVLTAVLIAHPLRAS